MAVYAQSGNRVKKIDEDEIQRYVEQGYKVIDAKGTVLNDAVPNDIQELKLAYRQHVDEIKSLKSEVERLKKQLVLNLPVMKSLSLRLFKMWSI